MNWIKDFIPTMKRNLSQTFGGEKDSKIPEGLWRSCDACGSILYIPELKKNSYVCSKCSHHFKISVKETENIKTDFKRRKIKLSLMKRFQLELE